MGKPKSAHTWAGRVQGVNGTTGDSYVDAEYYYRGFEGVKNRPVSTTGGVTSNPNGHPVGADGTLSPITFNNYRNNLSQWMRFMQEVNTPLVLGATGGIEQSRMGVDFNSSADGDALFSSEEAIMWRVVSGDRTSLRYPVEEQLDFGKSVIQPEEFLGFPRYSTFLVEIDLRYTVNIIDGLTDEQIAGLPSGFKRVNYLCRRLDLGASNPVTQGGPVSDQYVAWAGSDEFNTTDMTEVEPGMWDVVASPSSYQLYPYGSEIRCRGAGLVRLQVVDGGADEALEVIIAPETGGGSANVFGPTILPDSRMTITRVHNQHTIWI